MCICKIITVCAAFPCICACIYMQLVRELNRVMEKSFGIEIMEIWTDLAPRIIHLAKQERQDNLYIDELLLACIL